jgi:hypothetical protein
MSSVQYHDFLPGETPRGGVFGGVNFSDFNSCVAAMNDWLERNPVNVINFETVTLPNIHNMVEEGSTDTELYTSGHTVWYQFVRLWYSEPTAD